MAIATSPHRAREVLNLLGDPKRVDRELQLFRKAARVLSSNRPRLIDRHPKQWVAVHEGKVTAQAKTLQSLLTQVDRMGLSREHIIVRFIDRTQRTMIL
jgi:hypothetical protein